MHINWLGLSCIKITSKENIIITDPYDDATGLKMPKLKADITILSNPQDKNFSNVSRLSGENFLIDKPGEYEIKQTFVYGLPAGASDQLNNIIYCIKAEGMSCGFVGALNHSLTDEQLEILEGVDILFLPVGSLSSEHRTKIVSHIEPRIIIPIYFDLPKQKIKLDSPEKFAKEMGIKNIESIDKLVIKQKDLPQDENKVIFLKPSF